MKEKPKALDLFCGAGGASRGLQQAGFHVTGVDLKIPRRYGGDVFIQGDAMTFPLGGFDFIWASPPCQAYTQAAASQRNAGKVYPDLLAKTRDRLNSSGVPWIIENTPKAPMRVDIILCGSMFGLRLIRHRWFETNPPFICLIPLCKHHPNPVVACGNGTPTWSRKRNGGKCHTIREVREAMGIDWMNRQQLSQAIPPAYSKFLGEHVIRTLSNIGPTQEEIDAMDVNCDFDQLETS